MCHCHCKFYGEKIVKPLVPPVCLFVLFVLFVCVCVCVCVFFVVVVFVFFFNYYFRRNLDSFRRKLDELSYSTKYLLGEKRFDEISFRRNAFIRRNSGPKSGLRKCRKYKTESPSHRLVINNYL